MITHDSVNARKKNAVMSAMVHEPRITELIEETPVAIQPPESLVTMAIEDLQGWHNVPALLNVLREYGVTTDMMFTPWQSTFKGTLIHHAQCSQTTAYYHVVMGKTTPVSPETVMSILEHLILSLQHVFYTDNDSYSYRVGYAPVRLLGWWRKCQKDEIDWLQYGGMTMPCVNPTGVTTQTAPPRYGMDDLSHDGLVRICTMANSLQGLRRDTEHMVDSIEQAAHDTATRAVREYDGEEWAYWTGSNDSVTINRDDAYQMVLQQSLMVQADNVLLDTPPVNELVGLDFEMTGLDPIGDWVIDAGWARINPNEQDAMAYDGESRSYGVPESRMILGNPTETINGISTQNLAGMTPLEADLNAQDELLDTVTSAPLVVHNARSEDRFLEQCVDGYAEAKRDGLIRIIDTRLMSKWLDDYPGKVSNRLEDYARHWGILGEDECEAHDGLADVNIMLETLSKHIQHSRGVITTVNNRLTTSESIGNACSSMVKGIASTLGMKKGTHAMSKPRFTIPLPGSWLSRA